jgi:hypothetical protein
VRPSDAARLLGISSPSLKEWLDKGEIPSVLTEAGRREIPFVDVVDLLEEVEDARRAGSRRPVANVMRARRQRAAEIDVDDLLPRRGRSHRVPELQSLAYHRLVAARLDSQLLREARRRLRRWQETGRIHPRWHHEWEGVLRRPIDDVKQAISADTPEAAELRQTSPFAGVLTEQERRRLINAVEARGG